MSSRLEAGKLIVFEGVDGVGKSTLAQSLVGRLKEFPIPSECAVFPGREPGTIGRVIYEIHHDPGRVRISRDSLPGKPSGSTHSSTPRCDSAGVILPALNDGTWVILDRFWWSTWVYGCVSGANRRVLDAMIGVERMQWNGTQPDLLFLVDRTDASTSQDGEEHRAAYKTLYAAEAKQVPGLCGAE